MRCGPAGTTSRPGRTSWRSCFRHRTLQVHQRDRHSHEVGDHVLRQVAEVTRAQRATANRWHGMAARSTRDAAALRPRRSPALAERLREADHALHQVKAQGRNPVVAARQLARPSVDAPTRGRRGPQAASRRRTNAPFWGNTVRRPGSPPPPQGGPDLACLGANRFERPANRPIPPLPYIRASGCRPAPNPPSCTVWKYRRADQPE